MSGLKKAQPRDLHRIFVIVCFLLLLLTAACHRLPPPPANLGQSWGEQKTFDYQGIKINYYEAGRGQPIILLHGFGASAYTWRFLGPELAGERRVFTIDLKGHGFSDKPQDGKYAVSDQAEIVAAFLRAQNLQDAVLIGNSMGGGVALMIYFQLREESPPRIKGLVLIDSAGYPQKLPWFIRLARIPVLNTLGAGLLSPRFVTGMVLRKCYYNKDKITDEMIDTYAYYGSLPGAADAVQQTAKQIIPPDMEAMIAQYKTVRVPTLIIWGEQDEVVPLEGGRNFQRDIPDSELVILPRCGHIPQEEEPLETRRLIKAFLKDKT
ncbi:MAG: alpha/beta fold hydrolase [Deltaproteobacteria bacterium]|nr:alpha/beta fold hydrolase [Deltaproteobacteria bacterium]MBI4796272.1 alpha/beta fold hydrolase [Deltaproteobacteria bacterium]